MKNIPNLRPKERSFQTIIIFLCFAPRKPALNFQICKIKLFIAFDLVPVDNFWGHIWNQHILLVTILDFEENRSTQNITTHSPTHWDNSRARWCRAIAGPRREKKRVLMRQRIIRIEQHNEKECKNAHHFELRVIRRVLRLFLDVKIFWYFGGWNSNFHDIYSFGGLRWGFWK